MPILHINSGNKDTELPKLINHIKDGKSVFLFVHMDGCGPCNATKPEWNKIEEPEDENVYIADIEHTIPIDIEDIEEPSAFPSIRKIKNGKVVDEYESERDAEHFNKWIDGGEKQKQKGGRCRRGKKTRRRRVRKGRKTNKRKRRKERKNKH